MELKLLLLLAASLFCRVAYAEDDETDINQNQAETAGLYGSDVKLTQRQNLYLKMKSEAEKTASIDGIQNAVGREGFIRHWTNAEMPYVLDNSLPTFTQTRIREAMDSYESETCVRFVARTTERDYVRFFQGSGCYSYIGRIGGPQDISIGQGCESIGTIIHEIFHALGRFHEQSRPDRDDFVIINTANIRPDTISNFEVTSEDNVDVQGLDYDFGSVMHYSARAFSRNGLPTIEPRDSSVSLNSLGQRNGFSTSGTDVMHVKLLYCPDTVDMGEWSDWSSFSTCTRTCNGGTQRRTRTCVNGDACDGANSETQQCNTQSCPVAPTWGAWSTWSACNEPCGTGARRRVRTCQNGNTCPGQSTEVEDCNVQECTGGTVTEWGEWGDWGSCSRTCATGLRRRFRNCMNGNSCEGPDSDVEECNEDVPCTTDPSSGEWSQWSSCSQTCGSGMRSRTRMCSQDLSNCDTDVELCNTDDCPPTERIAGLGTYGCYHVPRIATSIRSIEGTTPELSDNPFRRINPITKCGNGALALGYRVYGVTLGICLSGSNQPIDYLSSRVDQSFCGSDLRGGYADGYFYMQVFQITSVISFQEGVEVEPSPTPTPDPDSGALSMSFPSVLLISFALIVSVFHVLLNY